MSEQPQQVEPEVPATDAPAPTPVADEALLAAVDLARRALLEVARPETVGSVVGHVVEDEHVLTLLFAADLSGYPGWHWSVTIARVEGSEPTVLETELMPGETALLAPEWVPWSERLADYRAAQEAAAAAGTAEGAAVDLEELTDEADEFDEDEDEVDEADLDDEAELDAAFGHDAGDDAFDGIDIDSLDDSEDDDSDVDDVDEDDVDEDDVDEDDVDENEDSEDDDSDEGDEGEDADDLGGDEDDADQPADSRS